MKQFIIHRNNLRKTWQIINEIIGKKTNSIDKTIRKNFPNESLIDISNNFAHKFDENVQNIIHTCNIKTINYTNTNIEKNFVFRIY